MGFSFAARAVPVMGRPSAVNGIKNVNCHPVHMFNSVDSQGPASDLASDFAVSEIDLRPTEGL